MTSPIQAPTPIACGRSIAPTSITSCGSTGMMMPKPIASMKMVTTMKGMVRAGVT